MSGFASIPKVELHLHLEGAAPPEFIRQLAVEQGLPLEGVLDTDGHYKWRDFAEFLECYMKACTVLTGPDAFRRLAEAVLQQSTAQNVVYTELFVSPQICGAGDPVAWAEHLAAIDEGLRAVPQVEARIIATAIRNFGPDHALRDAHLAADHMGRRLTGFGMAGQEQYLRPADFAAAFDTAEEAGLRLTCHAGEWCGPDAITETLDALHAERLGHGVRAAEDPGLMARLATEGVVLEVNPGSNIALGVYPDLTAHPIADLRAAGVPVTVSTDDPPYFHTTMTAEYERLSQTFGWDVDDFRALNHLALEAAFCDEPTRTRLMPLFKES